MQATAKHENLKTRDKSRYAKEFLAGWGTMDFNGHMGNTAYLNLAADVRMAFFAEHGFSPSEFRRLSIGPVVKKEEIEYFREIGLHETVTVTYAVLAMSPDGARFTIENEIWSAGGERAAVVRSTGGWLDLRARKLIAPPPELRAVFAQVPKAPGFVELPPPARNMTDKARPILTDDMKRVIDEQRLGFFATVCADGSPNLSPKGTIAVWDDNHLAFGNIRSPGTLENLRRNPNIDINVIDPFTRHGYRFKGVALILESGPPYDRAIEFYRARGSKVSAFKEIVLIEIRDAQFIDSPAYDFGMTESEIRDRWAKHYAAIHAGKRVTSDPEIPEPASGIQ